MDTSRPVRFLPKVGLIGKPNAEVRWTNRLDFWTVSQTNSLGFLDREPIGPERTAASCHVAVIGDSFVAALEVPIADKFHVRLEELAARKLPALGITASAFGHSSTGQFNQLPFYDEFARRLRPKLLALVFAHNDFMDNSPFLDSLHSGHDPDRIPWVSAERNADGTMRLRPPHPDWRYGLPLPDPSLKPLYAHVLKRMTRIFYFANWLDAKIGVLFPLDADPKLIAWAELLSRRPRYASLLAGWQPTRQAHTERMFTEKDLPPVFEEALEFTAFALDRFKERADRDGVSLVILSTHTMRTRGDRRFERMKTLAEARGIPVINQFDYILRQGGKIEDAHWTHDGHWNAAGHRWAAEALLEWLRENQDVCAGATEK